MRKAAFVTRAAIAALAIATFGAPAFAEQPAPIAAPAPPSAPPQLVVAISVDQFSSDLFAEYRGHFTGGLKRLSQGVVFPEGYQAHAATETCPGHSTILTGSWPSRSGIIANNWIDLSLPGEDKALYCGLDAEAARRGEQVTSASNLLVDTLGERLRAVSPQSRNIAVAGKDRSALMMGGKTVEEIYFWDAKTGWQTLPGKKVRPSVAKLREGELAQIAKGGTALPLPDFCQARAGETPISDSATVGGYRFNYPAGLAAAFRGTPALDSATLDVAETLVSELALGSDAAPDILSVGLSATDYIGHAFGTEGAEMCINLAALDQRLGQFFDRLDAKKIDYMVVLTADHGGLDLPERAREQGALDAQRIDPTLNAKTVDARLRSDLGLETTGPLLYADGPFGDYYLSRELNEADRERVKAAAMAMLAGHPHVEAVLDGAQLAAMPVPDGAVNEWTLMQRARAVYFPGRSGDFIVLLKQGVTPIADPTRGYVATHGSPWNYDRQVPIIFWRAGINGFEQPMPADTVDIAPTIAPFIGVTIPLGEVDGRCLDLDRSAANSCGGE